MPGNNERQTVTLNGDGGRVGERSTDNELPKKGAISGVDSTIATIATKVPRMTTEVSKMMLNLGFPIGRIRVIANTVKENPHITSEIMKDKLKGLPLNLTRKDRINFTKELANAKMITVEQGGPQSTYVSSGDIVATTKQPDLSKRPLPPTPKSSAGATIDNAAEGRYAGSQDAIPRKEKPVDATGPLPGIEPESEPQKKDQKKAKKDQKEAKKEANKAKKEAKKEANKAKKAKKEAKKEAKKAKKDQKKAEKANTKQKTANVNERPLLPIPDGKALNREELGDVRPNKEESIYDDPNGEKQRTIPIRSAINSGSTTHDYYGDKPKSAESSAGEVIYTAGNTTTPPTGPVSEGPVYAEVTPRDERHYAKLNEEGGYSNNEFPGGEYGGTEPIYATPTELPDYTIVNNDGDIYEFPAKEKPNSPLYEVPKDLQTEGKIPDVIWNETEFKTEFKVEQKDFSGNKIISAQDTLAKVVMSSNPDYESSVKPNDDDPTYDYISTAAKKEAEGPKGP